MAYPLDLLEQADHLARRDPKRPKQANLRRAVSATYYALFHLLIADAIKYWRTERQRDTLARAFEHGKMRSVCNRCDSANADLKAVAVPFVELQQWRHLADYDNSKVWTRLDVLTLIQDTRTAFQEWDRIRTQPAVQDFCSLSSSLNGAEAAECPSIVP